MSHYRKVLGVLLLPSRLVSVYIINVPVIQLIAPPPPSTFVCPTEILAFSDRIDEFKALNTEVVGCSVDSKYTHFAWIATPRNEGGLSDLKIPLLSDLTKQISRDYGVLLDDVGHALR